MIDTIVFDLGKVLVDYYPEKAMKMMGFSEDAIKVFLEKVFSGFWESCDKYPYTEAEIRTLFKRVVPGYEKEVDILWDKVTLMTSTFPYTEEWLLSLKKRGYRVLVLSNYGKVSFEQNVAQYPFLKHFDGGIISYQAIMLKPEPRIYKELIDRYNIVPENAVFIDDRDDNINAAKQFGLNGIVFTDYESASAQLEALLKA